MAIAKWVVGVDWDNDGDFSGVDEDVTGDTLGLTLEHFRDLASGHVEAARLELELKNDDHKYSPPNPRSPLSGLLKPGRKVWLRAAYPYDALADAPGVRLSGHAPDLDPSFSWTEHARGFRIGTSGTGAMTVGGGAGVRVATMDFGEPDVSFGCRFTKGANATGHGGLCFRYSDAASYMYVRVTGGAIEVRQVESGGDSLVASAAYAWPSGASRLLQVVLHGDSVRVFVDDAEALEATSSFNAAASRHGLYCDGGADHSWSDFGGWVSLFHGAVDLLRPRPRPGAEYCYLRALDEMERLTSVTLYTHATSQLPQSSDDILGDMLDYADASPTRLRLDAGVTLVPDTWSPSIWNVRALDEVHRLQDEEDGLVYVDGHGYWRLEARGHRAAGPHTAPLATLRDDGDGGAAYFSDIAWDDGAGNIENVVFMRIKDATNQGEQTAWTLTETPRFAAHETKEFLAESKTYDTVGGQIRPRRGTDYAANTLRDGTGTDISREVSVTHPARGEFNGRGTLVRVTFGPTAGYLTLLKLRTRNAIRYEDAVLVKAEDADSRLTYGERTKTIEARWTRETDTALATIEGRRDRRKEPKTVLRAVVPNGSRSNVLLMLQRSFSDRITVTYPDMGIAEDFFVEGRRITVGEGWTAVTAELLLQAV